MKTATRLKFSFSALALLALALPGLAQTNVPLQNIPVAATAGTADRFLMSAQSGTNWNARTITLSNLTTAIQALEDARNAFYVHADTNSAGLSAIMGTNGNLSYQPAALGASVGLGALIHFSAAVSQTNRPVRIMAFGDSLSDTTTGGLLSGVLAGVTNYLPLVGYVQSYYPLMWVQYGMTNSPGGGWYTTQPDTYWWFQHFFLPAGGQIGWGAGAVDGSGLPGTGIPSDDLSVKYVAPSCPTASRSWASRADPSVARWSSKPRSASQRGRAWWRNGGPRRAMASMIGSPCLPISPGRSSRPPRRTWCCARKSMAPSK